MHEVADEHQFEKILGRNEELAAHNKEHFEESRRFALNFMSAPGAGKTTLLINTIERLRQEYSTAVIEGDMVGEVDAQRLRAAGVEAIQINTGKSCHLDAKLIARVLHAGQIPPGEILFIENVGNLVCPAEFPLGEHKRVVLLSVTEGDDKPLKYPVIFRNCDAVVFTKTDLAHMVDFDIAKASEYVSNLNERAEIFCVSVKSGCGMDEWTGWIRRNAADYFAKLGSADVHLVSG